MGKAPLDEWRKTTLWFAWLGHRIEVHVWHPADIPNVERIALLAKHAAQGTKLIRHLTGTGEMITQGQYKND